MQEHLLQSYSLDCYIRIDTTHIIEV